MGLAIQLPWETRQKSQDLSTGFSYTENTWEVILRITGPIETLQDKFPEAFFYLLSGGFVIGLVPQDLLIPISQAPEVIYMEQPKRLYQAVSEEVRASCIPAVQQKMSPTGMLTGKGVYVAVIDSGIDYFHPDFRNEDGSTRIAWMLDDGIEYSREQINLALQQETRELAYDIVPVRDLSGHGTHVTGIAAGNGRASEGRYRGVAFESDLIVVKLGNARPDGFPKTTQLMEGVEYVKGKAEAEGKPVAINISFGNNYGSHTGESLLESYLSQLANQWKMSIVTGTGNEGNTAIHQEGRLATNQRVEVEWTVSTFETDYNLQLWKNYQDAMDIVLIAPNGQEVLRVDSNRQLKSQDVVETSWQNTLIYLYLGMPSPYSIYQEFYFAFLPQESYVDSGIWRIRIQGKQIKEGDYSLWLPSGGVLNQQTGFLNPSEETTLTIPSTTDKLISVGAYDSRRNQYASFSGRGFTWETDRIKPDLVAPGVDVTSCGVGGGYQVRSGTSMAAPFVTGTAALLMQWGIVEGNDPFLYGEKLKAYLIRGAAPLYQESIPSKRTGWGKLCALASFPNLT